MEFVELLGAKLLTSEGEKPTEDVLSGKKAVGIYFSAHWCPPCRGFTPQLAGWYKTSLKDKQFEVVFVSSDKDEGSFKDYFGEQPWVALPFSEREIKATLSKKYKVQGIPSFVILDSSGKLITNEGRAAVSKDPTGENFPWHPPTAVEKAKKVVDTLGPDLMAKAAGKHIGLYFSAHWCPPCRAFTPKLADFYRNGLQDRMEIVFVSSDRDEKSFQDYFGEMPWQALPFEKRKEKEELSGTFGVSGIPAFVIMKPDGTLLTDDGRSKVMNDPKGENLPDGWLPQPFNDVNDDPSDLNEETCCVMLGSAGPAFDAVKAVAGEHYLAAGKDVGEMQIRFFSGPAGSVTEQVRKLTNVKDDRLIILDIPSDGAFYVCDKPASEINEASVKAFLDDFNSKKLERKQLGR